MKKNFFAGNKGTKVERLRAMFDRLSPENRYYILGKAEGICVVQDGAAGNTPVKFETKREIK